MEIEKMLFYIFFHLISSTFYKKCLLFIYCLFNWNFVVIVAASYQHILADKAGEKKNVGLITLNRPKALNALCDALVAELAEAVNKFDKDDSVGAIVITGSEKAFAAGKLDRCH